MTTAGQFGHVASRLVVGLLIALAVIAAGGGDAEAKPKRVQEQRDFVAECRARDGASVSVGPRQVRCFLPDGSTVTCNFSTGVCTTVLGAARHAGGQSSEPDIDVVAVDAVPGAGTAPVSEEAGAEGGEAIKPLESAAT